MTRSLAELAAPAKAGATQAALPANFIGTVHGNVIFMGEAPGGALELILKAKSAAGRP